MKKSFLNSWYAVVSLAGLLLLLVILYVTDTYMVAQQKIIKNRTESIYSHTELTNKEMIEMLRVLFDNEDIVGYLKIEGTSIDYPLVQSADNEFYLDKDIYKNKSRGGWVFLDYENNINEPDKNTIIYGHNMKGDIMFHSLRKYSDQEFYNQHKYITLSTEEGDTLWEIFAYMTPHISFNYIQVYFNGERDYEAMQQGILMRRAYDTGVSVTPEDKILSLSTCSPSDGEYRIVISAKLISD